MSERSLTAALKTGVSQVLGPLCLAGQRVVTPMDLVIVQGNHQRAQRLSSPQRR